MDFSHEEYVEWAQSKVTLAMKDAIKEAAEEVAAGMVTRKSSDVARDQYEKGYIRGVQAAMEWNPNEA
jgi:hypothetical protein